MDFSVEFWQACRAFIGGSDARCWITCASAVSCAQIPAAMNFECVAAFKPATSRAFTRIFRITLLLSFRNFPPFLFATPAR